MREILVQYNILYSSGKMNPNAVALVNKNPHVKELILVHTSFLPPSAEMRERLYCIINNITEQQKCVKCGTPLQIKRTGPLEYPKYCSRACAAVDETPTRKRKETMKNRYGVEFTAQSSSLKKKMQETCKLRYGVENPFRCDFFQEKAKNTIRELYGVENAMHSPDIKEKHKRRINDTRYNNPSISRKLNDKEWLIEQHHIQEKSLQLIAEELTLKDRTSVSRKFVEYGLDIKHFPHSTGEREVADFLQQYTQVLSNSRNIIPPYEVDIYLPDHNIAIEYCGLYWHSEQAGKDKTYHKNKYEMCRKCGIQLITLYEDEWQQRQEQVKSKLLSLIGQDNRKRIYARKCSVISVDTQTKQEFFNNHHIQGDGPSSINIGLVVGEELVAVMGFIEQKEQHYLNRYATSCRVVGGFSKLLNFFQQTYQWKRLVSFADLRWSVGNLYQKTGWTLELTIPPDYYYSPDGHHRYHKFNYRRKNLPNLLSKFDPALSEKQNCDINNILRIWDCGKQRWVINHK